MDEDCNILLILLLTMCFFCTLGALVSGIFIGRGSCSKKVPYDKGVPSQAICNSSVVIPIPPTNPACTVRIKRNTSQVPVLYPNDIAARLKRNITSKPYRDKSGRLHTLIITI